MLGISMLRETEWDWFTAKEMAEIELTPEQREEAEKMWDGVLEAAKPFGGLEAYGRHLLAEQEAEKAAFRKVVELAIPALPKAYSWYIQGVELIGADEYGNQSVILDFKDIGRSLDKGLSIKALVEKEIEDMLAYFEE